MTSSLVQQIGGFAPDNVQVIKSPYCVTVAGGTVVVGQTIYEVSTYLNGVLQTSATVYQNESSEILTLPAATIDSLVAGSCDAEYDQEGDLICALGVTLKRIEVNNNSTGQPTNDTPIVVFVNPVTNTVVAPPASFTWGACSVIKSPITQTVYASAVGAITVPPTARREVIIFNRNSRDIAITWTGTPSGGGSFVVPARGTYSLSLTEDPNEGLFNTMTIALAAGGVGSLTANNIIFDFKN